MKDLRTLFSQLLVVSLYITFFTGLFRHSIRKEAHKSYRQLSREGRTEACTGRVLGYPFPFFWRASIVLAILWGTFTALVAMLG